MLGWRRGCAFEETELRAGVLVTSALELVEERSCAREHGLGQTREPRACDAVALRSGAMLELVQEDDVASVLARGDAPVFATSARHGELGELVVVRREEGTARGDIVEVLANGPRDRETIVRARAATDFVEQDERALGRAAENVGGLLHLDHERALATRDVVARADAREDAIDDADA